ncbi:MAG TPA: chromosome segregation protein SMC, partial [Terriglobia bacterium]|nr:chromosome segregation protein SMC [Terriglobia bacterium]
AKLESSRQNLARINDILEEIVKQVNSLKRQASKAARYKELHGELRARQKIVFASRLIALEAECGRLRAEFAAVQTACAEAAAQLEALESERGGAAARYEQLEEELKRMREALAASELESERLHSRLEKARQQLAALETRAVEAAEERVRLEEQAQALDGEAGEREQHAAEVRNEWSGAEQGVAQLLSQRSDLACALDSAEARVEAQRSEMLLSVSRASEVRNEVVKAEEMRLSAGRELARVQAERATVEEEYGRLTAEIEAIRATHVQSETALGEVTRLVAEMQAALESARREETALGEEVAAIGHDLSQASARRQALEESLARHAYSADSVRRLLAASTESFRPLGVLADFLEVDSGYEEVVEEFLKRELDCIVVEHPAEAHAGIRLLEGGGRSTFFMRSFLLNDRNDPATLLAEVKNRPGVVAALSDVVRFESRLGLNGSLAFPVLAASFIVEDSAAAERLAAEFPSCHFLTPQGEHYHHRCVSGGNMSSAGPLALRRDFRELERRVAELQSIAMDAERRWAETKERRAAHESELRRLSAEQLTAEKQSMLSNEKLRQAAESAGRAQERIAVHDRESILLARERETAERRCESLQAELEQAKLEQERKERAIAEAVESARQLRSDLGQISHSLTEAQVKSSALEERWRAAEADRARVAGEAARAREQLGHLLAQADVWSEERQRLVEETAGAEAALTRAAIAQQSLREQLEKHRAESQMARVRRDELSPQVDAARMLLEERRQKRSEIEVAQARAESDLGHHLQQCREDLGAEHDALRAEAAEPLEGEPLRLAEEQVRELKAKLERLGPVNMMALEELEEAEERLSFLDTQRQDLLASINDTAETIREIDGASRRKFSDAFRAINAFFAESFRTLFGGGVGEMRFSDEADPESGIDLVAQPPGKRLQNVLLLSGGEKALTALALLIAVFRFTPSPFCILDEVDAPLDESNVVRLARMIEGMSEQTQFILITHNKRTMETCRMLYGVTMEEAGVSKLVSVRFAAKEHEPVAVPA